MISSATISVLLPSHNGMRYLPSAVESILAQTHRDFELLLLDDGSTDDTPRFATGLQDPRLRYIRLEKVGLAAALNHGLQLANAPLIARMDADDIAAPERLLVQSKMFADCADLALAGVSFERIKPEGNPAGVVKPYPTDGAIRFGLLFCSVMLHPGVMFRKESALAVGGYSKEFNVAEDYDLWTKLCGQGQCANSESVLMQYRVHPDNTSAINALRQRSQATEIAARYAALMIPGVSNSEWRSVRRATLNEPLTRGEIGAVGPAFRKAASFFRAKHPEDAALQEAIAFWRKKLCWRSKNNAKSTWRRPDRSATWIRNALLLGIDSYRDPPRA